MAEGMGGKEHIPEWEASGGFGGELSVVLDPGDGIFLLRAETGSASILCALGRERPGGFGVTARRDLRAGALRFWYDVAARR